MCHFVLVFFGPFSIAITSLGEERANLSAFHMFLVCACLDLSVSSSSWGLGRAAVCDCGTPWTFLLPFLVIERVNGPNHIRTDGWTEGQLNRLTEWTKTIYPFGMPGYNDIFQY